MAELKTALEPGETLLRNGGANMQRGPETVGGHLYLTSRRLIFESHRFNIQTGVTEVPLDAVGEVSLGWTKFLGVVPLSPNAVVVTLANTDKEYRFTLHGRIGWVEAIQGARAGVDGGV